MLTVTYYTISHYYILPFEADKGKHKGKKI